MGNVIAQTVETVQDKYWIRPKGICEKLTTTHQIWAYNYLINERNIKCEHVVVAEDKLLEEGWIRVQVYISGNAGMEGTRSALSQNADRILEIVPGLKGIYIQIYPGEGRSSYYSIDEMTTLGWDFSIRRARKVYRKKWFK